VSRARAALLASDRDVEEIAAAELASTGSAIGGVIAGYFAAAGRHPGVLLSPLTLLIGGVGVGGRAFDGRLRQPGRGTRRPRGILPEQAVPDAARVPAVSSVAALAVALAYEPGLSLPALVRPGIAAAAHASARGRAALLTRIAGVGPAALAEASFVQPLLRLASPSQGGLLTPSDFEPPEGIDAVAREIAEGGVSWFEAPWAEVDATAEPDDRAAQGAGHAIVAVDTHGRFAALAYRVVEQGLTIADLDLIAPLQAVPVLRGVPRVAPGTRLSSPAPVAIVWRDASESVEVVAQPAARRYSPPRAPAESLVIRRDSRTRLVATRRYEIL